ncbi:TPA: hypothetical protein QCO65_005442 [Bacillus cereus]|uniref:hypothetical protein n=1 Tax=Bacillus sp. FSL H8-0545 TaxID=2921402 RepID=UPI0030FA2FD1|nr:hypothetical protein [Bacillus cereus]
MSKYKGYLIFFMLIITFVTCYVLYNHKFLSNKKTTSKITNILKEEMKLVYSSSYIIPYSEIIEVDNGKISKTHKINSYGIYDIVYDKEKNGFYLPSGYSKEDYFFTQEKKVIDLQLPQQESTTFLKNEKDYLVLSRNVSLNENLLIVNDHKYNKQYELKLGSFLKEVASDDKYFYTIEIYGSRPGAKLHVIDRSLGTLSTSIEISGEDIGKKNTIKDIRLNNNEVLIFLDDKIISFNKVSYEKSIHKYPFTENYVNVIEVKKDAISLISGDPNEGYYVYKIDKGFKVINKKKLDFPHVLMTIKNTDKYLYVASFNDNENEVIYKFKLDSYEKVGEFKLPNSKDLIMTNFYVEGQL